MNSRFKISDVTGTLDHCIIDAPMQQRINVTFGATGHSGFLNKQGLNASAIGGYKINVNDTSCFINGYYLEFSKNSITVDADVFNTKHYLYIEIDLNEQNVPVGDPNEESYSVEVNQVYVRVSTTKLRSIEDNVYRLMFAETGFSTLSKIIDCNRCMTNGTLLGLELDPTDVGSPDMSVNAWYVGSSYLILTPIMFFKKTLYAGDVIYLMDLPSDFEPVNIDETYPIIMNRFNAKVRVVAKGNGYGLELIASNLMVNSIKIHNPFIMIPFKRY